MANGRRVFVKHSAIDRGGRKHNLGTHAPWCPSLPLRVRLAATVLDALVAGDDGGRQSKTWGGVGAGQSDDPTRQAFLNQVAEAAEKRRQAAQERAAKQAQAPDEANKDGTIWQHPQGRRVRELMKEQAEAALAASDPGALVA